MKKLLLILFLVISNSQYAVISTNIDQNDNQKIKSIIGNRTNYKLDFFNQIDTKNYLYVKNDPQHLIDNLFKIPNYLNKQVHFWFNIYTKFDSSQVVIHDKQHLNIIYDSMDFTQLEKSKLGPILISNLRNQILYERISEIIHAIKSIKYRTKLGKLSKSIIQIWANKGLKIPKNKRALRTFLKKRVKALRSQTGLKDRVQQGLNFFNQYHYEIFKLIETFKLPKEILAVSFVESSFNTKAESRTNAVGVWQFMKRTGKHFLPIEKNYDTRQNVMISTISAFHLLKENRLITGTWPLAITAFNSGTKHILKMKKKYIKNKFSLQIFLNKIKISSIRFASKNYYSEFLAMVYALAYKKLFFTQGRLLSINLNAFLSKCSFVPNISFRKLRNKSKRLFTLNQHLQRQKKYPAGTIVISDTALPKKVFMLIKLDKLNKLLPKNYKKLIKNQSCSTR